MRTLVSFLAGIGLGFLGARELDRLISEKARLEAAENQMAGAAAFAPVDFPPGEFPGEPPERPGPHPADRLEEKTITCNLCTETFTEELPPMETHVQCPNCGEVTPIGE